MRAVAVLSVVGFHAFPRLITGGFIGVDIFFVISGYLISTIIIDALRRNEFSFREFYSRRVRRIFPALILVLFFSLVFGSIALLAYEYNQLARHVAGGTAFVSNFLLWGETGYFDNPADTKPLLHLWSLGIEEQFYIVWPMLLWLAWGKVRLLFVIVAIATVSFVLNIVSVNSDAAAAFFSPLTRFWELMAGSTLAYGAAHGGSTGAYGTTYLRAALSLPRHWGFDRSGALRTPVSIFGSVLVGIGFFVIDKHSRFPGWWALLPTVGAVLLIAAGPQAWVNRTVLSNRLLVWLGLISFPLYLWHWPLLSFARIDFGEEPPLTIRVAIILLSGALAWATYSFVEKPIRFGSLKKIRTSILLASMVVLGATGYINYRWVSLHQGLKVVNEGDEGLEYFDLMQARYFPCTPLELRRDALSVNGLVRCFQSKDSASKQIAIVGDSHAEHLFVGLADQVASKNVVYYTQGSLPVSSSAAYAKIFKTIIADPEITTVIIAAQWSAQRQQIPSVAAFEQEMMRTIEELGAANKKVYLAADVPIFTFDTSVCRYERLISKRNRCTEDIRELNEQMKNYGTSFKSISERSDSNLTVVMLSEYFCGISVCSMARDGEIFYRDRGHLNILGSKYAAKNLLAAYPQIAD